MSSLRLAIYVFIATSGGFTHGETRNPRCLQHIDKQLQEFKLGSFYRPNRDAKKEAMKTGSFVIEGKEGPKVVIDQDSMQITSGDGIKYYLQTKIQFSSDCAVTSYITEFKSPSLVYSSRADKLECQKIRTLLSNLTTQNILTFDNRVTKLHCDEYFPAESPTEKRIPTRPTGK